MKKKKRKIYRDAETGEFITKEEAEQRPSETVSETVDVDIIEKPDPTKYDPEDEWI